MNVYNQRGLWANEALNGKLKELLQPHIKVRQKKVTNH
jgi:hypothetical protein